jgi:long-chain alkane monooxygenase
MIHFNYIFIDSPTTHIQSSWLHPEDQQATRYSSSRYWCDIARTLERGYFDGIFFADILSVEEEFALDIIAFGGGIPRHDQPRKDKVPYPGSPTRAWSLVG